MNLQPIGSDAPSHEPMLAPYDDELLSGVPTIVLHTAHTGPVHNWTIHANTIKAAVAEIESAYNAILAHTRECDRASAVAIDEANRRVAEVRAEADAAVQRAQLQEQIRTSELHQVIERLRRELDTERRQRFAAPPAADGLSADQTKVSASWDQSTVAALQSELEAARSECEELTRQLESERAKRVRLIGAVRALQQPLHVADSCPVGDLARATAPDAQTDLAVAADATPNHAAIASPDASEGDSRREDAETDAAVEEVADTRAETVALHFNAHDYARQLLDDLESVYAADDAAGMSPMELVARLAGNLTYAADVFERRTGCSAHPERVAFDQHLAIVMDDKAATSFGRHLAVAAYDYEQRRLRSHVA